MLFKDRHIAAIETGAKTQTRRAWRRRHARVGGVYPMRTRLFGPGSEPRGWLRVTALREERLTAITYYDARREGGYTREQFLSIFNEINRMRPGAPEPVVTVVTFEYAGREKPA